MTTTNIFMLLFSLTLFAQTRAFVPLGFPHGRLLGQTTHPNAVTDINKSCVITVPERISSDESGILLDCVILPQGKYGERLGYGRDAQGLIDLSSAVKADDPRMAFTYGEFPTHSFDTLVDMALTRLPPESAKGPLHFVDIGSGCGRLVFHAGLTRGTDDKPWHIHGMEISEILHREAWRGMEIGLEEELFTKESISCANTMVLHLGPAEEMKHVFADCKLAFAYSTVWSCSGFSEELGAMVLHSDWSGLLSKACPKGCVVVTTDRALDPEYGWELLDRIDVDNREVMGSTGDRKSVV